MLPLKVTSRRVHVEAFKRISRDATTTEYIASVRTMYRNPRVAEGRIRDQRETIRIKYKQRSKRIFDSSSNKVFFTERMSNRASTSKIFQRPERWLFVDRGFLVASIHTIFATEHLIRVYERKTSPAETVNYNSIDQTRTETFRSCSTKNQNEIRNPRYDRLASKYFHG